MDNFAVSDPHRLTPTEVAAALKSDLQDGLSSTDARERLAQVGENRLAGKRPVPAWRRFLAQFQSPLVLLLLVATGVSVAEWLYADGGALPYEAFAIFAIVLANAALGYVQEARAEAAVAALRAMSADTAEVIRDGERTRVLATELVPGDLLLVEEGDTVAADARIVQSNGLQIAEAVLTGESVPVLKDSAAIDADVAIGDRSNMLYGGTAVTRGRGFALVTATAQNTEMGRIAGLLDAAPEEQTPLQRELDRTARRLGTAVVIIATIIVATIVLVERVHGFTAFVDVLVLGVALAVAAVPEGLPAIVTVVLSIGVQRMARRNAIVRHLAAVETLGAATVIASDKTGTLTRNQMTVRTVVTASGRVSFSGSGYSPEGELSCEDASPIEGNVRTELERALAAAARASDAVVREQDGRLIVHGDPMEGALLVAARKAGLTSDTLNVRFPRIGELPFSSERRLMTTLHRRGDGEQIAFTKGAPDVLLARCSSELVGGEIRPLTPERSAAIERVTNSLADDALRTLGVAFRHVQTGVLDASVEEDLVFLGIIGIIDPPRAEVRDAVARARKAGIRTVMITGDHPRTAAVIAREIGIDHEKALTGLEIEHLSDDELAHESRTVSVYARVSPEHKLRLVRALKSDGAIVAMTGDGVNDAPALKTADIGVAMGITGTDVSKEAADIILADDNFATIVAASEEGRAIFANIRKFLQYLLSSNAGEVLTMFFAMLLGERIGLVRVEGALVLPLLATQILWVNLVTDGAPALALGAEPPGPNIALRHPRGRMEPVITPRMWWSIVFIGLVTALATLIAFDASLPGGFIPGSGDLGYAQTIAFTTLTLAQLFNAFNARAGQGSAFRGLFANRWLWGAIVLSILLQAAALYVPTLQRAFGTTPITLGDWVRCFVTASLVLWAGELWKTLMSSRADRLARRDSSEKKEVGA